MPTQLLCPYTALPLAQSKSTNREHVLPVGLGCPESLWVHSDAAKNAEMNRLIDAPVINSSVMQFFAASCGVTSRSGVVGARLPAVVVGSGERATVEWRKDSVTPKFVSPVRVDDVTGQIIGVQSFGDVLPSAKKIEEKYKKKSLDVVLGKVRSTPNPTLLVTLDSNLALLRQELIKIGYLFSVFLFGDAAIESRHGAMLRSAFLASNDEAIAAVGLPGAFNQAVQPPFSTGESGEHVLSCGVIGGHLITQVQMFALANVFFVTPTEGMALCEGDGVEIVINAGRGTMTRRPFLDLAVQALYENKAILFDEKSPMGGSDVEPSTGKKT